ncbi:VWA3A protein, partial [Amia calva]|nr:VWA3A protein [Amia calva]
ISTELDTLPPSCLLPKPPNHDGPLSIEMSNHLPKTSADWLKSNGLKAKKLCLYQVLAPNAYALLEEFVPILRKTVTSTLHEKAMVQCEWHDGTVKNVHVDPPILYNYQKQLGRAVLALEQRVEWLTSGSRQIWGTVCEKRQGPAADYWGTSPPEVVILVDVSQMNSLYLIHIQHSLRLLLEQQLASKDSFNIIAFGTDVKPWCKDMAAATPENLQDAWQWILGLNCGGSRNIMGALKLAVELDLQAAPGRSQGVYLFTSGVPDQESAAVCGYVSESCAGGVLRLHVCLFSTAEPPLQDCIPPRFATAAETAATLRELARHGNGRFYWLREMGNVESDDIDALLAEMEKAVNYSQKCALLVDSLAQRTGRRQPQCDRTLQTPPSRERLRPPKLMAPRPTALMLARKQTRGDGLDDNTMSQKALTWRPASAKPNIPPAQPMRSWGSVDTDAKQKNKPEASQAVFYTEDGNSVGTVFKTYPKVKSVRKSIPSAALPKEEEFCSTKQWLKKFSIQKLKLDLHKLVSGPDCTHQKKLVPTVHKKVSAKYCTIFPSIQINGVVKHLQLTVRELEQYVTQTERVIRRYVQRMQWLLSGSRRLFGTILEKKVCILLDTSGSMDPYLPEVKKELTSLIWEQLHRNGVSFGLLSFSDTVLAWRGALAEPTEEACHDAVQWAAQLRAHGSTCTLEALQAACGYGDTLGIYLLSDGKPGSSCSLVLREAGRMTAGKHIAIHTISFNCSDSAANEFLRRLAQQRGGRFHRCHADLDAHLVAHRMLTDGFSDEDDPVLPVFEGDDLRKLVQEIGKARRFLTQARAFRSVLSLPSIVLVRPTTGAQ